MSDTYKAKSALARRVAEAVSDDFAGARDDDARAVDELLEACEPLVADLERLGVDVPPLRVWAENRANALRSALAKAGGTTR